ncbi:Mu transposase C-terminal domain-containing protein [Caenispirillum salinarum]|uniref:Mu transposase C-terminal domain-containing protein n=1 Tax=Caenispirillum salinarum TaxID=859058 RepID=UPI00384D1B91
MTEWRVNDVVMTAERGMRGPVFRILRLGPAAPAVVIDVVDRLAWPELRGREVFAAALADGDLVACGRDPAQPAARRDEDLTEAERAGVEERWTAIGPLVDDPTQPLFDPDRSPALVRAAAEAVGVSPHTLRTWLRAYWQGGQIRAALVPRFALRGGPGRRREPGPAKRGRPRQGDPQGGMNVGAAEAHLLRAGRRRFLIPGRTLRDAYHLTLDQYFTVASVDAVGRRIVRLPEDGRFPSLAQFRYHTAEPAVVRLRHRVGRQRFDLEHRDVSGRVPDDAGGPGAVYEIDATIIDEYVLSRATPGRCIGKPVVEAVIDRFSHCILGLHVGLQGPSYASAADTLARALSDQTAFFRSFGLDVDDDECPRPAVPKEIVCDRGAEFTGTAIETPARELGITVTNLPPLRGDLKGLVESRFRIVRNDAVKDRPGGYAASEAGTADPATATLTLPDVARVLVGFVLKHNRTARLATPPAGWLAPDGRMPSPIEAWRFGVERYGAPRAADPARVALAFGRRGRASVTAEGIRFRRLLYDCPAGRDEGWFLRWNGRRARHVDVQYDPDDVTTLTVLLDPDGRTAPARLMPKFARFESLTWEEAADLLAFERGGRNAVAAGDMEEELRFRRDAHAVDATARAARAEALAASGRRAPDVSDVRAARRDEIAAARAPRAPTEIADGSAPCEAAEVAPPSRAGLLWSARTRSLRGDDP